MPIPVLVPRATISMEQALLVRWVKQPGDVVSEDDTLFELETDKTLLDVPSPAAGTVLRIDIESGEVLVDQIVGWVGTSGEQIPPLPTDQNAEPSKGETTETRQRPNQESELSSPVPLATPAAKRIAKDLGVDWRSAEGTGPGGRITQEDVERMSRNAPHRRSQLSAHLLNAWQTMPHIHIGRRLDADALMNARSITKTTHGAEISVTDLLLFAAARVLREFPDITGKRNSRYAIDICLAVDTPRGAITPVIHRADHLNLRELSAERRRVVDSAQNSRLKLEDMQGGDFTLTNLGSHKIDFFAPIINSPQRAILATGRISQEAVVHGGELAVRWQMWANLAADHRFIDGALAAQFLSSLERSFQTLPDLCGAM